MKKAFIVVGHSNWGKSETLKCLTNGIHQKRRINIGVDNFRIKRMSNDDFPDRVLDFLEKAFEENYKNIIMALCPDFENKDKKTKYILDKLSERYDLFFFILKNKYGSNKSKYIKKFEIEQLNNYGPICLCNQDNAEQRCEKLKNYILSKI